MTFNKLQKLTGVMCGTVCTEDCQSNYLNQQLFTFLERNSYPIKFNSALNLF